MYLWSTAITGGHVMSGYRGNSTDDGGGGVNGRNGYNITVIPIQ